MGLSPCCILIETASSVIKVGIENMYKVKKKVSRHNPSYLLTTHTLVPVRYIILGLVDSLWVVDQTHNYSITVAVIVNRLPE